MIQNLRSLRGEFNSIDQGDLWDRAAEQWRNLVGSVVVTGISAAFHGLIERAYIDNPALTTINIGSAALTAVGLVATGIAIGGLNETGRTYLEASAVADIAELE